jgi:hypothetical protein
MDLTLGVLGRFLEPIQGKAIDEVMEDAVRRVTGENAVMRIMGRKRARVVIAEPEILGHLGEIACRIRHLRHIISLYQDDVENNQKVGIPSARTHLSKQSHNWGFYCFSCETMTYESLDVSEFDAVPGTVVLGSDSTQKYFAQMADGLEFVHKFVAISAPTGIGKTFGLQNR